MDVRAAWLRVSGGAVGALLLLLGGATAGATAGAGDAAGVTDGAATPAPVTVCGDVSGEGGRVTARRIVGDLLVESGSCALTRVVVTGDAVVLPGAERFALDDSAVKGDVRVEGAELFVARSEVFGGVVVDAPGHPVEIYWSDVRRSVRGAAGTLNLFRSTVEGAVTLRLGPGPHLSTLFFSDVGGWVTTRGGDVWAVDLDAGRGVTVAGASRLDLCGGSIALDLTVRGVTGSVELGDDSRTWGPGEEPCAAPAPVGGSVVLEGNPAPRVSLARLAVAGDLVCTGNTPGGIVVDRTLTVGGQRLGQCA